MIVNEIFASQQIGFPILSTLIGLPLVAALAIRFVTDTASIKVIALAAALAELLLALWLLVSFIPSFFKASPPMAVRKNAVTNLSGIMAEICKHFRGAERR